MKVWTLLLGLALVPFAPTDDAAACGGFFCNAQNPTPVIQAGERILFASHDGLVTMHIEITYQGDPTSFGWILPLAQRPMDELGRLMPLDQIVRVSSQRLFPTLQSLTDPSFNLVRDPSDDTSCPMPDVMTAQDAAAGFSDTTAPNPTPPVTVLAEADVGPFRAQLIEATRSDALYTWLGDNGYIQDPKAQPILDHYLSQGFVFVGLKLQSGKSVGDLRPIAITLGENAPCVPLVLTSIAARNDMPILVWVLGPSRAVPKNFLHAVADDRAFWWPGASNYQQVLSNALDRLGGRAWVTEFAGSTALVRNRLLPSNASATNLQAAGSLPAILAGLSDLGLSERDPDVLLALREHVPMPEGLTGFPNGNCLQCLGCEWAEEQCAAMGQANDTHETTEAEFYAFLFYWLEEAPRQDRPITVDVPALRTALLEEVVQPLQRIEALFSRSPKLTRFFAMISPDEMTRDPIFAFNPDLPDISNIKTSMWDMIDCGSNEVRVTYPDGLQELTTCNGCQSGFGSIAPITSVPVLRFGEVLDEQGQPVPFHPDQAAAMDTLVGGATLGQPTIPPTFAVQAPPEVTPISRPST
ncbi:MAG TPA: DUF2330 domain-containing protein, partial [Myxococcota bacterium]|nr:DUF2330 domain-containing protein [Myxococcota bacterium]